MGTKVKEIVDTNIILRLLVGDDKELQTKAVSYFKEAESGKRKLVIIPLVVAEVCFVLESFYKKTREDIVDKLQVFLAARWLSVEERNSLLNTLPFYKKGFHFVDSFLISWVKNNGGSLLTFDKKLSKEVQLETVR